MTPLSVIINSANKNLKVILKNIKKLTCEVSLGTVDSSALSTLEVGSIDPVVESQTKRFETMNKLASQNMNTREPEGGGVEDWI